MSGKKFKKWSGELLVLQNKIDHNLTIHLYYVDNASSSSNKSKSENLKYVLL